MKERTRLALALAAVAAVWAAASQAPQDPDFDWTPVLDAWRRIDVPVLIAVAVAIGVAVPAAVAAARRASRRVRAALFGVGLVGACALLLGRHDTGLSGDGLDMVTRCARGEVPLAHPLATLLHMALHRWAGLDPYDAVRLTSIGVGLIVVLAGLVPLLRAAPGPSADSRISPIAAVMYGCAPALLFLGSVETYAPLVAVTLLLLPAACRRLDGEGPPLAPPLLWGLAISFHGTAVFLAPAMWMLFRSERRARPGFGAAAMWCAAVMAPIALTVAATLIAGAGSAEPRIGAAGESLLLPLTREGENVVHRYALLDAEHTIAAVQCVFFLAPAAWFAFLLPAKEGWTREPHARFLVVAAIPWLLLPFVWNTSYSLRRDWDLFAVAGVPVAYLALRHGGSSGSRGREIACTAVAAAALLVHGSHQAGDLRQRRDHAAVVEWTLRVQCREDAAASRWRETLRALDPTDVIGRTDRAIRDAESVPVAQTEQTLRAVLRDAPDDPRALTALGILLEKTRRAAEAEPTLRAALASTTRENLRPPARMALARVALADSRYEEARRQYRRLLAEDSEHEVAADARSMLRFLESPFRRR